MFIFAPNLAEKRLRTSARVTQDFYTPFLTSSVNPHPESVVGLQTLIERHGGSW
jgi:hypothetical protein